MTPTRVRERPILSTMGPHEGFSHRVRFAAVACITAILCAAVLVGGLAWVRGKWAAQSAAGAITGPQFDHIPVGTDRMRAVGLLGRPLTSPVNGSEVLSRNGDFGPVPTGSACDFYTEADTFVDAGVMRFCYRDGTLVEKAAYDMGGSVAGDPVASTECAWKTQRSNPDCR